MQRYAIVSCNRYVNFTNYDSALQTYALRWVMNHISNEIEAITLNYCPSSMAETNPLNPIKHMWDQDERSKRRIEENLSAIRENYFKFERFYETQCGITPTKYTDTNFNESLQREELTGYICGSDTIWNTDEFGIDPGYFGCFDSMRNSRTIAYAACFGDAEWSEEQTSQIAHCMQNFKSIGVRENARLAFVREHTTVPAQRVVDPTLLAPKSAFDAIAESPNMDSSYLLYYSRRYNPMLEAHAESIARRHNLDIVEISLRSENSKKGHIMRYDAGVEEFVGLVKNAQYVVTNSFHGAIFAIIFNVPFSVFTREQASTKINELLEWVGLSERQICTESTWPPYIQNFAPVNTRIALLRNQSLNFLTRALGL